MGQCAIRTNNDRQESNDDREVPLMHNGNAKVGPGPAAAGGGSPSGAAHAASNYTGPNSGEYSTELAKALRTITNEHQPYTEKWNTDPSVQTASENIQKAYTNYNTNEGKTAFISQMEKLLKLLS